MSEKDCIICNEKIKICHIRHLKSEKGKTRSENSMTTIDVEWFIKSNWFVYNDGIRWIRNYMIDVKVYHFFITINIELAKFISASIDFRYWHIDIFIK